MDISYKILCLFKIKAGEINTPPCVILPLFLLNKPEVRQMVDLRKETIQELFFNQVKRLTLSKMQSFDLQFSDAWLNV